ncbi:MAG: hypothetical protein R2830_15925 [Saprospiraceae bacterium]
MLNKILWRNANRWQLAGAMIGVFLGLSLLLCALQFYFDVRQLLGGNTDESSQYVQLNKKINIFNTLGVKADFGQEDIKAIESQPYIQKVGIFEANQFEAGAYSDMLGFYTELFFEAIPDEMLDVDEPAFRWSVGQADLPILMSKEYLALYNFGFAPGRGLPQLTPSTIQRFSLDVKISGKGKQETFKGKVVGFSSRINSILVPASFMKWANETFADGNPKPSKLLVRVDNPMSSEFRSFLNTNNLEVSAGNLIGGQFGVLFKVVLLAVGFLGVMILVLAILVFNLNFQVLISKAYREIQLLLQIGYKAKSVTSFLDKRFSILFGATVFLVFAIVFTARIIMVQYFENQGFTLQKGLNITVWLAGAIFSVALLLSHLYSTKKTVARML